MTRLMLLSFQDSITGFMNCCIFSYLHDQEPDGSLLNEVSQMVVDGIASIISLGEKAYDTLKSLHAGGPGRILQLDQWLCQ